MKSNQRLILAVATSALFWGLQVPAAVETSQTIKCMSAPIGSANFNWSFQIFQDVSKTIDAGLDFDDLKTSISVNNKVRDVIKSSLQKSMMQTIQNFDPKTFLQPEFNGQTEVMKIVNQFSLQLGESIKNGLRVDQEVNFQLMIAPKISEELSARRAGGGAASREIPIMTQYPSDRLVIYNNMTESDSVFKSASEKISTEIYAGISEYFNKAYECQIQKPFLTSALMNIKISPDPNESSISAQIILGMPSGIEIPFAQANDQVRFQKIVFPKIDVKNLAIQNGGVAIASQYPAAIVFMQQKIASPDHQIPVLIEFGPLGNYQNGRWKREHNNDIAPLVPKLKGFAVGNFIKSQIAIDFNIYNLQLDIAKQELIDLDIYLSVGYSKFPNQTILRINRPDVDQLFQSEVNKTVRQQIKDQKDRLSRISEGVLTAEEKEKIINVTAGLGDEQGVSPDFVKQLMQALFGALDQPKIK